MKTYRVEVNGKSDKVSLPESWSEMTLGHMVDLEALVDPTPLDVFNTLTGKDVSEAAPEFEAELYDAVRFIYSPPDWDKLARPTHLVIHGVPYPVPAIEKETLGQGIMVSQIAAKAKDLREMVIPVLAIYFQPAIDRGKFDRHRLPVIEKQLRNVAAVEGFAVAYFFIGDSRTLRRIIATASPLLRSPRMARLLGTPTTSPPSLSGSTTL